MPKRRSVTIDGLEECFDLEDEFWWRLEEIAHARRQSIDDVVREHAPSHRGRAIAAALRVSILLRHLPPTLAEQVNAPSAARSGKSGRSRIRSRFLASTRRTQAIIVRRGQVNAGF